MARWEIVHGADDLGRLLGVILGLPGVTATDTDLAPMNRLRTAITRIAYGLAAGASPRPEDVEAVNAAAAHPSLVPALLPQDGTTVLVDTSRPGTRRWCSMERCGNRAKARAHRDRTE